MKNKLMLKVLGVDDSTITKILNLANSKNHKKTTSIDFFCDQKKLLNIVTILGKWTRKYSYEYVVIFVFDKNSNKVRVIYDLIYTSP